MSILSDIFAVILWVFGNHRSSQCQTSNVCYFKKAVILFLKNESQKKIIFCIKLFYIYIEIVWRAQNFWPVNTDHKNKDDMFFFSTVVDMFCWPIIRIIRTDAKSLFEWKFKFGWVGIFTNYEKDMKHLF